MQISSIAETNKEKKIGIGVFYFSLIDIMFLPYIYHLPIKFSMFILLYWVIKKNTEFKNNKLINFLVFAVTGIISICIGVLKNVDLSILYVSIQTLIIIIYGYLIYEFLILYIKKYEINVSGFLVIYLVVAFLFMLLYLFKPSLFFTIRPFWTLQRAGEQFVSFSKNRFTFLVSEPNNFAALVNAIMAYLLLSKRFMRNEKLIIIVLSLCLVISTASISGMFYFAFVLLFYFAFYKYTKYSNIIERNEIYVWLVKIMTTIIIIIIILAITNIKWLLTTDIINTAFGRFNLYFREDMIDLSGDRLWIWRNVLSENNLIRYIVVGDCSIWKPHSGHLYIIFGFGCIAYIFFMKVFFFNNLRDKQALAIRLVFFAVFTMNTLIGDLRSFTLFAVLLGATAISYDPKDKLVHYIKSNKGVHIYNKYVKKK